ncbi:MULTISPECIES: ABC transporter substrate-binding protein [unclassified Methanothrix]|jgi:iron complex transport system substrate-binding protein|uniref:ABC transporter substrate-binding protein n=1 Tax=unclassified Methanothrix TaxID=2620051 RepID=UPI0025804B24|nr:MULTISPECIES: ABC transporter substrate-binding protein [unclassified Methanothrix]MCK9405375.1 ABC transporter substrate-binding protein [Methanothrix sp.]
MKVHWKIVLIMLTAVAASQFAVGAVSGEQNGDRSHQDLALGIFGDANMDGVIDEMDVAYVEGIIKGTNAATNLSDADYDGKIDEGDITQIEHIMQGTEKEITFIDYVGRIVTLKEPIDRIIALDHYGCEMVRAVKANNRLVAGMRGPDYWPELVDKPEVGGYEEPDYEAIVDLKPDVVITSQLGDPRTEEILEPAGIPVVRLDFYKPKDFVRNVQLLGIILGQEKEAGEVIDFFQKYLNTVQERVETLKADEKKRVYYEGSDYKSVAEGSGWHEWIEMAGGANIFAGAGASNVAVDPEEILKRNPQLVWRSGPGDYIPPNSSEMEALYNTLISRPGWDKLDAVKNNQVHIMTYWNSKGCAKLIAITYLAKYLYPEMFQDIDPEAVAREWYEKYQGVEYKGGYVYPPKG